MHSTSKLAKESIKKYLFSSLWKWQEIIRFLSLGSLIKMSLFTGWYVGLPYYLEHKSSISVIVAIVLGNYLKINIIFYYYQTYFTHPGQVPSDAEKIKTVSTICKKCIHPKPPRTHHCSVCDQCVLKVRKTQKQFFLHWILPKNEETHFSNSALRI